MKRILCFILICSVLILILYPKHQVQASNEIFSLYSRRVKIAGVPGATLLFKIQIRNLSEEPVQINITSELLGTKEALSYQLNSQGKALGKEFQMQKLENREIELSLKTIETTPVRTQGSIKLVFTSKQKDEFRKELLLYFYIVDEIAMLLKIGSKNVSIKDQDPFELDFPPYIKSGRTFVPIRFIGESFGATIQWYDNEKKVSYALRGKNLSLWINQTRYLVNGIQKTMDVPPEIQPPGRTFVPLRIISEELGAQVDWSAPLQEIRITYRIVN